MPEAVSALSIHLTHNVATGRLMIEVLGTETGTLTTHVAQECSPFTDATDVALFVDTVVRRWMKPSLPLDSEELHDLIP